MGQGDGRGSFVASGNLSNGAVGFEELLSRGRASPSRSYPKASESVSSMQGLLRRSQDQTSSAGASNSSRGMGPQNVGSKEIPLSGNESSSRSVRRGEEQVQASSPQLDGILSKYNSNALIDGTPTAAAHTVNVTGRQNVLQEGVQGAQGVPQYALAGPNGLQYVSLHAQTQSVSAPTPISYGSSNDPKASNLSIPQQQQQQQQQQHQQWNSQTGPPNETVHTAPPGLGMSAQQHHQFIQHAPQYVQCIVQQPHIYGGLDRPQVLQHPSLPGGQPYVMYPQQQYTVQYGGSPGQQQVLGQSLGPHQAPSPYKPVQLHFSHQPQMLVQPQDQQSQSQSQSQSQPQPQPQPQPQLQPLPQPQQPMPPIQVQQLAPQLQPFPPAQHLLGGTSALNLIPPKRSSTGKRGIAQKKKGGLGWTRQPTSSFYGVSWHKRSKKWVARLWQFGRSLHVGIYPSEVQAALAIDVYLTVLGSSVSQLNFPDPAIRQAHLNSIQSQGLQLPPFELAQKAVANIMSRASSEHIVDNEEEEEEEANPARAVTTKEETSKDAEDFGEARSATGTHQSTDSSLYGEQEEDTSSGQSDSAGSGGGSFPQKRKDSGWGKPRQDRKKQKKLKKRSGSLGHNSTTCSSSDLSHTSSKAFGGTSSPDSSSDGGSSNNRIPDQRQGPSVPSALAPSSDTVPKPSSS